MMHQLNIVILIYNDNKNKSSERYILTFLAHLNSNTVYICRAAKANSINIKNILFQFCLSYISYKKHGKDLTI